MGSRPSGVDLADQAFEDQIAVADAVDHARACRSHGRSRGSAPCPARRPRAAARRPPRCRRRAARPRRRRCRRSRVRRRHVDVVHPLAVDADAAARDPVEHDLERHLEVEHDVERRPSRICSNASAWGCVRGKPSSTKPSPSGPSGASASCTTPITMSSGTSSPASMYSFAFSPNAVSRRASSRKRSPVEKCAMS